MPKRLSNYFFIIYFIYLLYFHLKSKYYKLNFVKFTHPKFLSCCRFLSLFRILTKWQCSPIRIGNGDRPCQRIEWSSNIDVHDRQQFETHFYKHEIYLDLNPNIFHHMWSNWSSVCISIGIFCRWKRPEPHPKQVMLKKSLTHYCVCVTQVGMMDTWYRVS